MTKIADWNLSSTELESGNALGAFLQTPAPVLDKISGPTGAELLSSTGLGFGTLIERERERERAKSLPVLALDKNRSPIKLTENEGKIDSNWLKLSENEGKID